MKTSARLFLVDDDARTARRFASMLEEDGYVVELFFDGAQALERFVQHRGDCAKWGPSFEYPRHLHSTIACTCGLIAALAPLEPPEAK